MYITRSRIVHFAEQREAARPPVYHNQTTTNHKTTPVCYMSKTPYAVMAQNVDYGNRRLWVLAKAMNLCKALYRRQPSDSSGWDK
jgi:hypothetical protein